MNRTAIAQQQDRVDRLKRELAVATARLQELEDGNTVLVEFRCGGTPYAYRYPEYWAEPQIGDEVVTPPTYNTGREQVVTVVGYGRGGYDGPLRTLTGRVSR